MLLRRPGRCSKRCRRGPAGSRRARRPSWRNWTSRPRCCSPLVVCGCTAETRPTDRRSNGCPLERARAGSRRRPAPGGRQRPSAHGAPARRSAGHPVGTGAPPADGAAGLDGVRGARRDHGRDDAARRAPLTVLQAVPPLSGHVGVRSTTRAGWPTPSTPRSSAAASCCTEPCRWRTAADHRARGARGASRRDRALGRATGAAGRRRHRGGCSPGPRPTRSGAGRRSGATRGSTGHCRGRRDARLRAPRAGDAAAARRGAVRGLGQRQELLHGADAGAHAGAGDLARAGSPDARAVLPARSARSASTPGTTSDTEPVVQPGHDDLRRAGRDPAERPEDQSRSSSSTEPRRTAYRGGADRRRIEQDTARLAAAVEQPAAAVRASVSAAIRAVRDRRAADGPSRHGCEAPGGQLAAERRPARRRARLGGGLGAQRRHALAPGAGGGPAPAASGDARDAAAGWAVARSARSRSGCGRRRCASSPCRRPCSRRRRPRCTAPCACCTWHGRSATRARSRSSTVRSRAGAGTSRRGSGCHGRGHGSSRSWSPCGTRDSGCRTSSASGRRS